MKVRFECPLGMKCEATGQDEIIRCAWYTKVVGKHPQTGQDIDDWACSMAWMPILLLEVSRGNRSTAAATESMRNEVVKRQDFLNTIINAAAKRPELEQL